MNVCQALEEMKKGKKMTYTGKSYTYIKDGEMFIHHDGDDERVVAFSNEAVMSNNWHEWVSAKAMVDIKDYYPKGIGVLTDIDKAYLRAFYIDGYRWVAKDYDGEIVLTANEPSRNFGVWSCDRGKAIYPFDNKNTEPFKTLQEQSKYKIYDLLQEYTPEELEIAQKLYDEGYRYIARDKNRDLYAAEEIAGKCVVEWLCQGTAERIDSKLFSNISWEDEYPTRIIDILNCVPKVDESLE